MLQQLSVGIRRLGQYQKPNQRVLNTTPAFALHWLPRLAEFRCQHPNVDLWIFSTDEVPDMATQTITASGKWTGAIGRWNRGLMSASRIRA